MSARIMVTALIFAMVVIMPAWGQRTGSNWPSPPPSAQEMPQGQTPSKTNLEQQQKAAELRKVQVQKDMGRLSQLVNELKQELDKTPAGTLSLDAVKKSKEIEKMAKRVHKEIQTD